MIRQEGVREKFYPLVLVLVTLGVGLPLFLGRVLSGHDVFVYLINAQQTMANLRAGELFPAWGGDYYAGYGSPALLFFPPLTNYVHAVAGSVGVPIINGVCMLALVAYLASGLALMGWMQSIGLRGAALPASIVYMLAPYRPIDLYSRTALAEHWAFIWPPLILWVVGSSRLRLTVQIPLLALLVAALLLTNIPLAALFGISLGLWFLFSEKIRGRRLRVVAGATLGFALASFTLVPQALATSLLAVEQFFGSEAGAYRVSENTLYSGGLGVWDFNAIVSTALLVTFALATVSFVLLAPSVRKIRSVRLAMLGALVCALAATAPGGALWDHLPVLSQLQFPWRVAALLTLIASILTAQLTPRRAWVVALLTAIVTIPFLGWTNTLPKEAFKAPEPPRFAPGAVFPDPHVAWEASSGGWYWEHETLVELCLIPENMKPFFISELAGTPSDELNLIRGRPATVIGNLSTSLKVVSWGSVKREIEISTTTDGTLIWRAISFPDMRARVDGLEVETSTDPTTGLLAHFIPAGTHIVEWSWHPFPALRWAQAVTMAALLVTVSLMIVAVVGRPRHRQLS